MANLITYLMMNHLLSIPSSRKFIDSMADTLLLDSYNDFKVEYKVKSSVGNEDSKHCVDTRNLRLGCEVSQRNNTNIL